jgi:predicted dehydrogenase
VLPDSRPIPVALIGLGWVGTHRHLPAIRADRRFRLVGVIDRDPERVRRIADRSGVRGSVGDGLEGVPWLAECRAVAIATAPAGHAPLIAAARERGLHVLTEKPFTVDPRDAENLGAPGGPVLGVMHNFQFARSARRLWADLSSGRLGPIRAINAVQLSNPRRRLPTWYETLPLGLFYDESPHFFYLLRRAAPGLALRDVDIVPGRDGRRTPLLVRARYGAPAASGEIPVSLSMQFESPVSEWHLAVFGERAIGIVDVFRDIYLRVPQDGLHTSATVLRTTLAATAGHWSGYLGSGFRHVTGRLDYGVSEVYARFAAGVAAGADPDLIGRSDAIAVVRMAHEVIAGVESKP